MVVGLCIIHQPCFPKGSVLGQLLFLLSINDLHYAITGTIHNLNSYNKYILQLDRPSQLQTVIYTI